MHQSTSRSIMLLMLMIVCRHSVLKEMIIGNRIWHFSSGSPSHLSVWGPLVYLFACLNTACNIDLYKYLVITLTQGLCIPNMHTIYTIPVNIVWIFIMHKPWVKHFEMTSTLRALWPWPWTGDPSKGRVFHKHILCRTVMIHW